MADLRQVEVVFKVGASAENEKKPSEKVKAGTKNKVHKTEKKWYENIYVNQAWNYVKADITKIANYEINKWFSLRDDYIGQRTVNAALNVISRAKNMTMTIAAGFTVGGIAGAAIAAAGSLITLSIDIAQNYDRERVMLRQMDAQLDYQRQRAGYSLTSGRVGENK